MMELIKEELNKTVTENGDIAYTSTLDANLDFFGLAGACRYNQKQVIRLFLDAYDEDPSLALMNMLYLRDIRRGLGERDSFRTCFRVLSTCTPDVARQMLDDIVELGRIDDLLMGLKTPIEEDVVNYIAKALEKDLRNLALGKPTSYLAKWLPSENATSYKTVKKAKYLIEKLGYTPSEYRKILSSLRANKIIENNLREKDYSFDYENVPGNAFHKYHDAFIRNDKDRYLEYMESVKQGVKKVHSDTLYPYDIIRRYKPFMSEEAKQEMQILWDNFPKTSTKSRTIVVRDGSGSMTCNGGLPMHIATSLAILFAQQLEGEFKNSFITFSSHPQLIQLKGNSLFEDLKEVYWHNDISNTDIEKVYRLILDVVDRPDFKQEDMIDRILIISDMEFDVGVENVPTYETFKEEFEKRGLALPEIVYWNVCAHSKHFAAKASEKNIRFVSGASQHTMDTILNNEHVQSAYELMIETLKPYQHVTKYLEKGEIS